MKSKYQWQGEPVKIKYGYVLQMENIEKDLYWYNFECYTKKEIDDSYSPDHFVRNNGRHFSLIPAIKVQYQDQSFVLANHYGIGVHKLLNGGWPNYSHFSLDGEFKEDDMDMWRISKFDLDGYEHHETERNKWQSKQYPEQYAKLKALREAGRTMYKKLTTPS